MAKQPREEVSVGFLPRMPGHELEGRISPREAPADRKARIDRETADAKHARWRSTGLFAAVLIGVAAVAVVCGILAVREGVSPDDRKWAMTILGSIVSAGVGFLTGKQQGR